jgi:hypothetical protein
VTRSSGVPLRKAPDLKLQTVILIATYQIKRRLYTHFTLRAASTAVSRRSIAFYHGHRVPYADGG